MKYEHEYLCRLLRSIAEDDANEEEFNKHEHTCWLAADAIEQLNAMLDGKDPSELLRKIADDLDKKS